MPARDVTGVIAIADNRPGRPPWQGLHDNSRVVGTADGLERGEEDRLAPWQHLRPAMRRIADDQDAGRLRGPAVGRYAQQVAAHRHGVEDDVAVVAPPRPARGIAQPVANGDRASAGHGNLLELLVAVAEEANPAAIRREKG